MSANAMFPTFTDRAGYLKWRAEWKIVYSALSQKISEEKAKLKVAIKEEQPAIQKELHYKRVMARKMMTLLQDAKLRRDRILAMHQQLADQQALFPLRLDTRVADFAYNRIHNEFDFMPRWLIKASGKTYYINHLDAEIGFTTKEMVDPRTKGMLRFRNTRLEIDTDANATVRKKLLSG